VGIATVTDVDADPLAPARSALARHDWPAAHAAVPAGELDDPTLEADRLDLLAEALWWLGRLDECIIAREAAYRAYESSADAPRAAQCAVWLYEHHAMRCRPAVGTAWLRRARRVLEAEPPCPALGALLLREAEVAHGGDRLDDARELAEQARRLARTLGSADLEAEALQTIGRVLIDAGQPDEGLVSLDEAMLLAVEGRLGPYSTGKVYCSLISACEELGDLRRAAEWTDETARWAQGHPFAVFPGICRVHRAVVLQRRGALADAEREAMQACGELLSSHLPNAVAAYAEVGDIRRRRRRRRGVRPGRGAVRAHMCRRRAAAAGAGSSRGGPPDRDRLSRRAAGQPARARRPPPRHGADLGGRGRSGDGVPLRRGARHDRGDLRLGVRQGIGIARPWTARARSG
jgi:tetratricopeptide (TPR) repeat protein